MVRALDKADAIAMLALWSAL